MERALDAAGLSLGEMTIAMEMNSNEAICGAVERGAGAAFLSRVVVARAVAQKKVVVVPISGLCLKRHLYVISDSRRALPAPARAFLEFAEQWRRTHLASLQR